MSAASQGGSRRKSILPTGRREEAVLKRGQPSSSTRKKDGRSCETSGTFEKPKLSRGKPAGAAKRAGAAAPDHVAAKHHPQKKQRAVYRLRLYKECKENLEGTDRTVLKEHSVQEPSRI